MYVPMAEHVARERRNDDLKRAELHRLAKLARGDRSRRLTLVVESIRRGLARVGRRIEADVSKPVTE